MIIDRFTRHEWKEYSEEAHKACFGTFKPRDWDRYDFALAARTETTVMGYVTCREMDSDTLYWQFGGSFPGVRTPQGSLRAFQGLLDWVKAKYKRLTFLVENDNCAMLKMAMLHGFRIVGIRNFKGSILLEHLLEFEGA